MIWKRVNCEVVCVCSCMFLSFGVPAIASDFATNAPRLICDSPAYNFGRMFSTNTVEHEYLLRNDGTGPLQITSVKIGCGCTAVKLEDKSVASGQETRLLVSLNLRGRQGLQKKSIYVHSNDPINPIYQLQIIGDTFGAVYAANNTIVPAARPVAVAAEFGQVVLDPGTLDFGNIRSESNATKSINMSSRDGQAIHVLHADVMPPCFKVAIKTVEQGRRYQLDVCAIPPLKRGSIEGGLRVVIKDYSIREIHIPIIGWIENNGAFIAEQSTSPASASPARNQ